MAPGHGAGTSGAETTIRQDLDVIHLRRILTLLPPLDDHEFRDFYSH